MAGERGYLSDAVTRPAPHARRLQSDAGAGLNRSERRMHDLDELPEAQHQWPYAIACAYCRASAGVRCTSASGGDRAPHRVRWASLRRALRQRESVRVLLADDPRFGLSRGDLLRTVPYPYDNEKVTVLERLSDGFDPECNQYSKDLRWLGFADEWTQLSTVRSMSKSK